MSAVRTALCSSLKQDAGSTIIKNVTNGRLASLLSPDSQRQCIWATRRHRHELINLKKIKKGKKKMARFCCWEGHHYVSEPDHRNGPDRDRERRIRRGRDESTKHVSGSAFKEHLFKCYHRQFTIIKWPLINKGKEKNNKFPPIIQCTIRLNEGIALKGGTEFLSDEMMLKKKSCKSNHFCLNISFVSHGNNLRFQDMSYLRY